MEISPQSRIVISERIAQLREYAVNWNSYQKPYIGQRIYGALEGITQSNISDPWMLKNAAILAGIITNSKPIIFPKELIVGYNYYGKDEYCFGYEMSICKRKGKLLEDFKNYLRMGVLTDEQIEFILDVLDESDLLIPKMTFTLPTPLEIQRATQEGLLWAHGTAQNHTIIDYQQVLQKGFRGILESINSQIKKLSWDDPSSVQKRLLLESSAKVAEAACAFGQRYRSIVQEQLQKASSENEKNDLKSLLPVLDQVPEHPAQTFHQAVQSFWFAHIINTWEDGINANSIGRIDQILYPYYIKDKKSGILSDSDAFELIASLWLKLYRDYDVQQAVVGGLTRSGVDGTNELTYLILDVTDSLDLIRCLSVRLHKGSPQPLFERALKLVQKGYGIPFFFNDDVLIPALVDRGIALEDARDYAAIGCVEITIPGKANPHAVSNRINLLKCLELALNDGKTLNSKYQIGPQTGSVDRFNTMKDIIDAYHIQVEYFTTLACFESNRFEAHNSIFYPMVFKSMLTEGCLTSGLDFNAGGALYNYHESMPMGIPNVADSLEAIDCLVFREKKMSFSQMVEQLRENFSDEMIHQLCLNRVAKYGNDQDHVDQYAHDVFEHFALFLKTQKIARGLGFFPQPFTFLWLLEAGRKTSATPDGRRKGDNLAYSLSPMQGRDVTGLTAVINSLSKFPYLLAAGGPSSIIEIDPDLFDEKHFPVIVTLLQTAIEKGVGQIQLNVITAEKLEDAQRNPEKYPNLAVRVSGYSQKFALLDKPLQDHIIARHKHKNL